MEQVAFVIIVLFIIGIWWATESGEDNDRNMD